MPQDKHDTQKAIGTILAGDFEKDAIHIAVAPMTAFEKLIPGQDVGVVKEGVAGITTEPVGRVDPFLRKIVQAGEKFFVFLYPNTITSLRHEWTHPVFDQFEDQDKKAAEEWIKDFADNLGITYGELMNAADKWRVSGDFEGYTNLGDNQNYDSYHGSFPIFWKKYEILTGNKPPEGKDTSFFSCAC